MNKVPQPKAGILEIDPYVGGESKIKGVDRIIKLSSNEGALGPSPKAVAAYKSLADDIHRYPDGGATRLRHSLAERWNLDAANIVCGNGSDDVLQLLAHAYCGQGDEVLYSRHGFLVYPIAAKSCGATPVTAPESDLTSSVDALLAAVTEKTRILFVANPNNPTGTYLSSAELHRLQAGLPSDVLLVIDAAYAEFVDANDYEDGSALVTAHSNVVMTRTFSKIFSMGGLRLGWAYCPPAIADVLNRIRGPFNVGAPALAAGEAALFDRDFFNLVRQHNLYWRGWLAEELTGLGLSVTPSATNFLLVKFPDARAADAHLRAHGIIVRAVAAYGLPEHLRITIGREDEVRAVAASIAEFLRA
jgi:histidinol-phosphate aminotransferase